MDIKDNDVIRTETGYVFNPYNPLNQEITQEEVQLLLARYNVPYPIHNMTLFRRAFIHRSYTKRPLLENVEHQITVIEKPADCLPLSTKSNENLEFLGDGVLELVAKYLIYRRFPKSNEGFKTEKKIVLVKNEAIGKIALEMGLHKWLILSRNAEEKKTRTNLAKLGCLFEAFIGALFLDFNKIQIVDEERWFETAFVSGPGFQMAQLFIEKVFEQHVDWNELIQTNDNYKNLLQIHIQKKFKVTPSHVILSQTVEEGYRMGVYLCLGQPLHAVNVKEDAITLSSLPNLHMVDQLMAQHGKILLFMGEGTHRRKRKAEQMACHMALLLLRQQDEQQEDPQQSQDQQEKEEQGNRKQEETRPEQQENKRRRFE